MRSFAQAVMCLLAVVVPGGPSVGRSRRAQTQDEGPGGHRRLPGRRLAAGARHGLALRRGHPLPHQPCPHGSRPAPAAQRDPAGRGRDRLRAGHGRARLLRPRRARGHDARARASAATGYRGRTGRLRAAETIGWGAGELRRRRARSCRSGCTPRSTARSSCPPPSARSASGWRWVRPGPARAARRSPPTSAPAAERGGALRPRRRRLLDRQDEIDVAARRVGERAHAVRALDELLGHLALDAREPHAQLHGQAEPPLIVTQPDVGGHGRLGRVDLALGGRRGSAR